VVALFTGAIRKKKKKKRKFSKLSKNTCEIKKLCTRFEKHVTCESGEKKQEEHVPRHIELTAVLRDLKTKNRVIELKI
jgi:hypothetical protein